MLIKLFFGVCIVSSFKSFGKSNNFSASEIFHGFHQPSSNKIEITKNITQHEKRNLSFHCFKRRFFHMNSRENKALYKICEKKQKQHIIVSYHIWIRFSFIFFRVLCVMFSVIHNSIHKFRQQHQELGIIKNKKKKRDIMSWDDDDDDDVDYEKMIIINKTTRNRATKKQ